MKGIKIALVVQSYGHFAEFDHTASFMSSIKLTILVPKNQKCLKCLVPI